MSLLNPLPGKFVKQCHRGFELILIEESLNKRGVFKGNKSGVIIITKRELISNK